MFAQADSCCATKRLSIPARAAVCCGQIRSTGITKSYAKALAPHVRVNTFAPGFMETEALLARPEWKAGRQLKTALADVGGGTPIKRKR